MDNAVQLHSSCCMLSNALRYSAQLQLMLCQWFDAHNVAHRLAVFCNRKRRGGFLQPSMHSRARQGLQELGGSSFQSSKAERGLILVVRLSPICTGQIIPRGGEISAWESEGMSIPAAHSISLMNNKLQTCLKPARALCHAAVPGGGASSGEARRACTCRAVTVNWLWT